MHRHRHTLRLHRFLRVPSDRGRQSHVVENRGPQIIDHTPQFRQRAFRDVAQPRQLLRRHRRLGLFRNLQVHDEGAERLAGLVVQFPRDSPAFVLVRGDELLQQLAPQRFLFPNFLVQPRAFGGEADLIADRGQR